MFVLVALGLLLHHLSVSAEEARLTDACKLRHILHSCSMGNIQSYLSKSNIIHGCYTEQRRQWVLVLLVLLPADFDADGGIDFMYALRATGSFRTQLRNEVNGHPPPAS
jgi:hypothetical protein